MKNPIVFLRWLLVFVGMITVFIVGHLSGLSTLINKNDPTFITWGIIVGGTALSLRLGVITYLYAMGKHYITDKKSKLVSIYQNAKEEGWLGASIASKLGFLGTGIGIVMALEAFSKLDTANPDSLRLVLNETGVGVTTALYTTIAGLVINMFLVLQTFNLEKALKVREILDREEKDV
jgi:hypothetical protein